MTSSSLKDVELVKEDYDVKYPQYKYQIKSFGVKVKSKKSGGQVLKWEKIVGFSLWQVIYNV